MPAAAPSSLEDLEVSKDPDPGHPEEPLQAPAEDSLPDARLSALLKEVADPAEKERLKEIVKILFPRDKTSTESDVKPRNGFEEVAGQRLQGKTTFSRDG